MIESPDTGKYYFRVGFGAAQGTLLRQSLQLLSLQDSIFE